MRAISWMTVAAIALLAWGSPLAGEWTQWGGPDQAFEADSRELADRWPEAGPKQVWSRELGDGYSTILVEGKRLYTMYRQGEQEVVVALDATTGKTRWEHAYEQAPAEGHVTQFGSGPRSTPTIIGKRIFTVGITGQLRCLNKKDGSLIWSKNLWGEEFGGNVLQHGYSSSPLGYDDLLIVMVGGENAGVVAFDQKTGEVRWKALDQRNNYSSPRLVRVAGEPQLLAFMQGNLNGLDPKTGEVEWTIEHDGANVSMPVMLDENTLFVSSLRAGARGLRIERGEDGKCRLEELWSTRKIQYYHVNSIRQGDWLYGVTGANSPTFLSAINLRTGEIGWRERGYTKANLVAADGKLVILDEDGRLYLATVSPEGLKLHSQAEILKSVSWTTPTIVGPSMYVRDKETIAAYDLGS